MSLERRPRAARRRSTVSFRMWTPPWSRRSGAGAIITCKTTTCESGYKLTADSPVSGITRNPWPLGRTSGGSSGGAAAAMPGCGPLAIATDGVGSIRVPCSFCGVFVLKPTYGLVPRSPGFFPPSWPSLAGIQGRSRARSPMQHSSSASSPATTDAIPVACRLSAAPSRRDSAGSMACASASARTSVMRRWSVTCAPRSGTRSMRWRIRRRCQGRRTRRRSRLARGRAEADCVHRQAAAMAGPLCSLAPTRTIAT